jgi:hypothetical protein
VRATTSLARNDPAPAPARALEWGVKRELRPWYLLHDARKGGAAEVVCSVDEPVVFIGSGEASVLERKTLIHSIRKNTRGPVRIVVFNGTHNTLEVEGAEPLPAPMSLRAKYLNLTEFSNYRFLVPQLSGAASRAIYLDSDMICLGDIRDLFEAPMDGADFVAKPFADGHGRPRWALSVSLFDCTRCRFDLERYVGEIDRGLYAYNDLHQMTPAFLAHHAYRIGRLDEQWNRFDRVDATTKLIHYTNLHTQPWRIRNHRFGALWFHYFREAQEAGLVSEEDIELAIRRGYARADLRDGNTIGILAAARNALSDVKASLRWRSRGSM